MSKKNAPSETKVEPAVKVDAAPLPADPAPAPEPVAAAAPVPDPAPAPEPVAAAAPVIAPDPVALPEPVVDVDKNQPLEIGEDMLLEDEQVIDVAAAENIEPAETKTGDWKCEFCAKLYPHRSYLIRHMQRGHRDNPRLAEVIDKLPAGTTGRPKGSTRPAPAAPDFSEMAAGLANPVDYKGMSNMLFDTSTGLLVMTFGPEWHPRPSPNPNVPDEKVVMVGAIENYLRAKDVKDIPPGLMLTMVCVAYAAPRFRAPETSRKLGMTWQWIKFKFGGWFRRKKVDLSVVKGNHD